MKAQLENQRRHFEKENVAVSWGPPCSNTDIETLECAIGVALPDKVRAFYLVANGLGIEQPAFELYSLKKIERRSEILVFAEFDNRHKIGFDTRSTNVAGQWDILSIDSRFVLTHTMESFVFNKIPAWVDRGRMVWCGEDYE